VQEAGRKWSPAEYFNLARPDPG